MVAFLKIKLLQNWSQVTYDNKNINWLQVHTLADVYLLNNVCDIYLFKKKRV